MVVFSSLSLLCLSQIRRSQRISQKCGPTSISIPEKIPSLCLDQNPTPPRHHHHAPIHSCHTAQDTRPRSTLQKRTHNNSAYIYTCTTTKKKKSHIFHNVFLLCKLLRTCPYHTPLLPMTRHTKAKTLKRTIANTAQT